jgi:predicted DNA-binding protein
MKGHVLVATHLPIDLTERLNKLAQARSGIPRSVLVRESIKQMLEREELKMLEEELQRKARRAAVEA